MKRILIAAFAASMAILAVPASAGGGFGMHNGGRAATLDVDLSGGAITDCQPGHCRTYAEVDEETDGYVNSSPRAQGSFDMYLGTGGHGFNRGKLDMYSGMRANGDIDADASRVPATVDVDLSGDISSVGTGDKVYGHQSLEGAIHGDAVDTRHHDDASGSAGLASEQHMTSRSSGPRSSKVTVDTSTNLSVNVETDDGRW